MADLKWVSQEFLALYSQWECLFCCVVDEYAILQWVEMIFPRINGGWHSLLPCGSWQLFVQLCSENIFEHLSSCVSDKRWCLGFVTYKSMKLLWKKIIFCTALKWCNYSNFQWSLNCFSSVLFIGEGRCECTFSFVSASAKYEELPCIFLG